MSLLVVKSVETRGRRKKYETEEERYQASLEKCRRYRASAKGKKWFSDYYDLHRDNYSEVSKYKYLMRKWGSLYDAMIM